MVDKTKSGKLHEQIEKVIQLLEEQYQLQPTSMLKMIIKRYKHANETIEKTAPENLTRAKFSIDGGARAYLEAASDYMKPMLAEMSVAEKLLKETIS